MQGPGRREKKRLERRQRVLDEGARRLRSGHDPERWLTNLEICIAADVPPRQFGRDFESKDEYLRALIEYVLVPPEESSADWSNELVSLETAASRTPLTHGELVEAARAFGEFAFERASTDDRFRSQLSVWLSVDPGSNSKWSRLAEPGLRHLYRTIDEHHVDAWRTFFARPEGLELRDGWTVEALILAATALLEGMLLRHKVDPGAANEDTMGRALAALVSGAVEASPSSGTVATD